MQTEQTAGTEPIYPYGSIEKALVAAFRVPESGLGSFQARLARLGTSGVPAGKPRSGRQGAAGRLEYTQDDAHQLAFALTLQSLGVQPALGVTHLTRGAWIAIKGLLDEVKGDANASLYVIPPPPWVVGTAGDPGVMLMTVKRANTKKFDGVIEIKVGSLFAKIDAALKKES